MIPAGEEDDGDTTSIVLTQEPNGVVNMELDMLAAASEAEARIAEEKLQAEIEKKAMADEDRLAAPASAKKRKGEKEEESKKKPKKSKKETKQHKVEESESEEEEPDYVERTREIAAENRATKKKEQKRKEREAKERGDELEEEEPPKKPKSKKAAKPKQPAAEKQPAKSAKKKNKPQAAALTQASDEDSGDESPPPQTPPQKKPPKKAPPAPKKEVKKSKGSKIAPASRAVDESSDDEDEKTDAKTTNDGYAVSDEPYRFGVSKMDKVQAGVGRRDSDLVLTFFHSSVKGKFASDNLQVPFGTHPSETLILYPSTRMKMGQQITFGCKGQERHNWKEFYDMIAAEVKPVGRLKIYDDGSLFRIRAQLARECQVFYADNANDLNTQDNLAPSDITGNYVHHAICGRMSLLKLSMQETTTIEDGTVTWIYPSWIITHLLIINKVNELPPLKSRPLSEAKPRGRQAQLKSAANGTTSLKSFYPVTWQ